MWVKADGTARPRGRVGHCPNLLIQLSKTSKNVSAFSKYALTFFIFAFAYFKKLWKNFLLIQTSLFDKLLIIFRRNDSKRRIRISGCKKLWLFGLWFSTPFELIGTKHAIFFYQINFFLVVSAPEIQLGITACVSITFHSFAHHQVFPQSPMSIRKEAGAKLDKTAFRMPLS